MLKIFLGIICFLFLLPSLSGCGFRPLYGAEVSSDINHKDNAPHVFFAQIQIASIPDRDGQFLYNLLLDRLNHTGVPQNPRYVLKIESVQQQTRDLDLTKRADATRAQMRLSVRFRLIDAQTQTTLFTRHVRATTSYNILGSRFATRVSAQSARESGLSDLARQIEENLAIYFYQKPKDHHIFCKESC